MPKREPTPPQDDDLKYFVVNYPFPLHANMQIPEERLTFAQWISCSLGQEYLTAIYHKPSVSPIQMCLALPEGRLLSRVHSTL